MSPDVELVGELITRFPSLAELCEDNTPGREAPSPLTTFWDITQEVVAAFLAGEDAELDWKAVLAFLEEQAAHEVPEIDKVLATAFLWYLPWPGQPGYELTTLLGPILTARFARIRPAG